MKAMAIQSNNTPPMRMSHLVQKPQKNPHLQLALSGSPGPETRGEFYFSNWDVTVY